MVENNSGFLKYLFSNVKPVPVTFKCFIVYKGLYLSKEGKLTSERKDALIIKNRSAAKDFVNKHIPTAKVIKLTKEDYDYLRSVDE